GSPSVERAPRRSTHGGAVGAEMHDARSALREREPRAARRLTPTLAPGDRGEGTGGRRGCLGAAASDRAQRRTTVLPQTAGAAPPGAAPQNLSVTVKQLPGTVSASTDDGKTWKRAAVGDAFGPGTLFRTGLRSGVTCTVGSDQMFTLESLTTMRVEEAARTGG